MKRAMILIVGLAVALVVVLVVQVERQRCAGRGPAGGTGVIEGVDVAVTSRISTRIAKVDVREGDLVKRGQVLVELDCREAQAALEQAIARLREAEASFEASSASASSAGRNTAAAHGSVAVAGSQLAALEAQEVQARLELERAERLFAQGAVSTSERDAARARHQALADQVAAQRASVGATRAQAGSVSSTERAATAQARAAEASIGAARASVDASRIAVLECTLTAPRDGRVATRALEPGEVVQPGTLILALTDVSDARTRFYLPNAELAAAAPGRRVRVTADAYPREVFAGTIISVSPRAEFTPRNVQTREDRERLVYAVEVRIPNPDQRLREGMPVEVAIVGSER